MSETYVPSPGDIVRFYSWTARLDLTGEVLSVAPQARMATVREEDEVGQTFVKSWDVLRPVQRADRLTRSLVDVAKALQDRTEERDEANTRAASWWEAAKEMTRNYYAATETAQRNHDRATNAEGMARMHRERQQSIADERDNWMAQAIANKDRTDKAEIERDYWKNRAEITHLQHVAANKRADEAEADRDGWVKEANDNQFISRIGYQERDEARAELAAAEARIEELEDQNRILKSDLDHARAAGEALRRVVEKHTAETWTDHDGTVRRLGGITRADLARQLYDENERAGREKARADKAEADHRQVSSDLLVSEQELSEATMRADAAEARKEKLEADLEDRRNRVGDLKADRNAWMARAGKAEANTARIAAALADLRSALLDLS